MNITIVLSFKASEDKIAFVLNLAFTEKINNGVRDYKLLTSKDDKISICKKFFY